MDNYAVAGTDTTTRMYAYGAVASQVRLVKADRQTPSYMRSPPELPYMFALESALDELAYALKMDPVELRKSNDTQTGAHRRQAFQQPPPDGVLRGGCTGVRLERAQSGCRAPCATATG